MLTAADPGSGRGPGRTIHDRASEALLRIKRGCWESVPVVVTQKRAAICSLLGRTRRWAILVKGPDGKTGKTVTCGDGKALRRLPTLLADP